MWTVRIVQSGKINSLDQVQRIPPKVTERTIVRLADLETTVSGTGIDLRCIGIIELEGELGHN